MKFSLTVYIIIRQHEGDWQKKLAKIRGLAESGNSLDKVTDSVLARAFHEAQNAIICMHAIRI